MSLSMAVGLSRPLNQVPDHNEITRTSLTDFIKTQALSTGFCFKGFARLKGRKLIVTFREF